MRGTLALAFFFCFAAINGFAQSRLDGKWATDRPADPLTVTDAQRKQSVMLEVTVDDVKASGTLTFGGIGGTFYTFKDGKVTDNKALFRVDPQARYAPTYTIEMVDDNTVMLWRGDLPLVGNNVLDLLSVLGGQGQPAVAVQVAETIPQRGVNASISGTVQDSAKALIPGATVTAVNIDTGAKATALTNESGLYRFPSVVPGKYTMTASISGFKTTTINDLNVGDTQFLQDFTLELPVPYASGSPSAATCRTNGIVWCTLLHRAK